MIHRMLIDTSDMLHSDESVEQRNKKQLAERRARAQAIRIEMDRESRAIGSIGGNHGR